MDISVPLRNEMVHWPGDPPVKIERVHDMEHGESNNLSVISMGSHTGTHIDAPLHFIKSGAGIDMMPLEVAVGLARVIEIQDPESIKVKELIPHNISCGERILFKTRNSSHAWKSDAFVQDFVSLSREAALLLAESGVAAVGVDYLSVGGYKRNGSEVHRILLGAGVWLIEGLDLSQVVPGYYDMICLPLRLYRGDGAPARAILRPVPAQSSMEED
ncbi:MAG: cyclase family protein [Chloroflexi bacterium]|nr:cyclase family protein [Chloroflexota bacterium]